MFCLAKLHPRPVLRDDAYLPTITLLIPAHNEADVIRRKLENSTSLDYPKDRLQILVVDDGSEDNTPEIVSEYTERGVTLIRQPERGGKMRAVNTGFGQASGDIVILSDASPSYEKKALRVLIRPFADARVGVVVGTLALWDAATAVAKPAGLYWKYEAALRKWESLTGSTVAVHGNMFAVRRHLYRPLKTGTINDEFSIAMEVTRQGYRVIYEPAAISYDDASSTMNDELKRRARINAGRYQALFSAGYLKAPTLDLTFRLFSHKLLRPLTPLFMVLMVIANPLALIFPIEQSSAFFALRGLWGWLVLVGQIAFYGLALLGWNMEKRGKHSRLLNIPYFFVSSNFAALVGLWRWVRGSQRVAWAKRTAETR
jgi:cellulose synthase/poly-beta-1,6-N-acetylglucosamine synthase-like glycosyltransferase